MLGRIRRIGSLSLIIIICCAVVLHAQPPTVPAMADDALDQAAYVALAKQWKAYIDTHGESVSALLNLAKAYRYSGEQTAALNAAQRAAALAPDSPEALHEYGSLLFMNKEDRRTEAMRLLERARELAPDFGRNLTMLAAARMQLGELEEADKIFRTIHNQDIFPRFLQDMGYNMLVGLPSGAVLITNGDNDTFPLMALQAGMDFRTDVIVLNRHLLNAGEYRTAFFKKHPGLRPDNLAVLEKSPPVSTAVIRRMIEDGNAPVYIAVTVPLSALGLEEESCVEGLNLCFTGSHLTPEESARLFLDSYRLDSAMDWSFAWDLKPAFGHLAINYVGCMYRVADRDGLEPDTRRRLIAKAIDIASFHDMDRLTAALKQLRKKQ